MGALIIYFFFNYKFIELLSQIKLERVHLFSQRVGLETLENLTYQSIRQYTSNSLIDNNNNNNNNR